MKKTQLKRILAFLVVGTALVFALSACRPSPALEQIIYTQDAKVVDVLRKKYEQDQRREESEKKDDLHGEEEGDKGGQEDTDHLNQNGGGSAANQTADRGSENGGTGSGAQVAYAENGTDKGTASGRTKDGGNAKKKKKQKNVKNGDGGLSEFEEKESGEGKDKTKQDPKDQKDPEELPGNPGQSGSDDEPGGEEGGNTQQGEGGTPKNTKNRERKTIDYGGITQEVPVGVDTVAAYGYAAQLVEMLGGSGRLSGADQMFLSNWLAPAVISDLAEVNPWWSGDGTYGMDDASFQALLNAAPEALIEISGDFSINDAQLAQLTENQIAYVIIPRPTSSENLINGAKIIATMMDDDGSGGSSMRIAENYESWIAQVKSEVFAGDAYVYSTLVAGWDDAAHYRFSNGNFSLLPAESGGSSGEGYGAAVGYTAAAPVIVNEFFDAAGVTNEASNTGAFVSTEMVYLTPMFHNLSAVFDGGIYDASVYDGSLQVSADWGLVHPINGEPIRLGEDNFFTVITADNATKTQIENSWYWAWHGEIRTSTGIFNYAYVPEDASDFFWSSICGTYNVLVNPSGLGSWITGSVDAPLEAYWLACFVRGDISEADLYNRIRNFYSTFYHVSLSDGDIAGIMYGD